MLAVGLDALVGAGSTTGTTAIAASLIAAGSIAAGSIAAGSPAPVAQPASEPSTDGRWREAARADATDRWPR
jgi:hypothetical protein